MAKSSQGGDQLVREARIALPILGLLFLAFILAGYRRFSGWGDPPPASVPAGPANSATQGLDSVGGQAPTTAIGDPLRAPKESVQPLPGAEIRRPPNLDRLTRPPQDQNPLPGLPSQGLPNPNSFRRLPSEPHSPARGEENSSDRRFQLEERGHQPGTTRGGNAGQLSSDSEIHSAPGNRLSLPQRNETPSADSEGVAANENEPPRTLADRREFKPVSNPGLATPIPRDSAGEASASPIRMTGLSTPESPTSPVPARPRGDFRNEEPRSNLRHSLPATEPVAIRIRLAETDSYWTIAEQAYGSGQYFRAVHAFLQDQGLAGRLRSGSELVLPSFEELSRRYREFLPRSADQQPMEELATPSSRSIIANGTRSLFEIAAEQLGQAARFDELLSLNRARLPDGFGANDVVPAGTVIHLPPR